MSKERIDLMFQTLKEKNEKAFVAYIMAGDGGLLTLRDNIQFLQESGVSLVELGIPFSDPVADGPTIQEAGLRALREGTTLKKVLNEIASFRESIEIPIVIMTYMNPVYAYGVEQFANDCELAGIDGLIIPDVPMEEEAIIHPYLKEKQIALIRLVTLTSPLERIKAIAEGTEGFLYAVTVTGTTGERSQIHENLGGYLQKLKEISPAPVLAGFGISTHEQVKGIGGLCDGVIVGSKIVDSLHFGKHEEIIKLINPEKTLVQ
ncbi:tryptophan synthase alpha chain [Oikeobacillus pervagus]|uniref:Tryptophan synthase alpha chain n=1 Tax=Oikeobacillus pervagus TaxID=1325931 RepID=A0AAJ1WIF2_9BACI|nr:tryptophan synthase subunit alpha [Oikeobacillus pervagus]MDQ0214353.1 tryptophan synthase alpha chain [Oikeobacillus pervagus]